MIAVVGCGYWGKNLVRTFSQLGELIAVCDTNFEQAEKFSKEYRVSNLSFDEILHHPDIKAVVISLPAEVHYKFGKKALEHGKHVFVEKPLALTVAQGEELQHLAQQKKLVLMVGHLLQYHPAFLKLKEMVHRGDLGKIYYLYSNRLNFGKIRRHEDILWSFAPHDISMILSLVDQEPNSVETIGGYFLHNKIADVTTTHFSFPRGEQAHIFVSWLHPFKEQKLVIVGDQAMAIFNDNEPWDKKLCIYPHKVEWKNGMPEPEKADPVFIPLQEEEPLKKECAHFIECVKDNRIPITDGNEGLKVLRVLEKATNSLKKETHAAKISSFKDVYIHESSYVDEPVEIGKGSKIWHFSHILGHVKIGNNCIIGQNVMIGPYVTVGNNCKIQNNVSLYKGVVLEDSVFCGPSCVFTNVNTPRADIERKDVFLETYVEKGVTIGANATIVCGNRLGKHSLIAAGAVITKDVKPHALMAGVPAKQIGWVSHAGEVLGADLVCPREKRKYHIQNESLKEII